MVQENNEARITLRFSFDEASTTKKLNSVRGVVKCLLPRNGLPENVEDISMSPEDELTLFFYIGEENRESLENYAMQTFQEMQRASHAGVILNEQQVHVNWILACDWKAAVIVKGINPANSDYFCLWCHCQMSQICDFSIPSWPIQRLAEEQVNSLEKQVLGYRNSDLLPYIPYTSVCPDDLHLRIRISLKLFNQVVCWSIDQKAESKLENELRRIGVAFRFWEERADNKTTTAVKNWSQPSGDDLKIIIKQMTIHNVLNARPDRHLVLPESLSVEQLRMELENRGLSKKGKKLEVLVRLKEAIGNGVKIRKMPTKSRLQVSYYYCDDASGDEVIVGH